MDSCDNHTASLSSEQRLNALLQVEAALAIALAKSGIISQEHAEAIGNACQPEAFDADLLDELGKTAGTPVIPLVKELVAKTKSHTEEASRFIHFGATSQDILDTATVLLLKDCVSTISKDLSRIQIAFTQLAQAHVLTPMLGRTLLQAGPPISFGQKAAGWAAAVRRGRERIEGAAEGALCLQFGGAVGNLSSLNNRGLEVSSYLAEELGLPLPPGPWHSHRDQLVELASAVGIMVGSLGKIARDISLHMQGEVAELREPAQTGKGTSSAMPHKRNPVGCMHILSAANRAPALVSSLLSAMPQEHERGLGGWQSEWPSLKDLFSTASNACSVMTELAEGIEVDSDQMLANLTATNEVVFSERLAAILLSHMDRVEAQELVASLVNQSTAENKKLSQIAGENSKVQSLLTEEALLAVFDIEQALGSSSEFIHRLLEES